MQDRCCIVIVDALCIAFVKSTAGFALHPSRIDLFGYITDFARLNLLEQIYCQVFRPIDVGILAD